MRSGSRQAGFAYVLLLVAVAVIGVAASSAVVLGTSMARRDAEQQLLAIGEEFQRALQTYAGLPPGVAARGAGMPGARGPRTLDDLLKDPRAPGIRRHLRQVYADPLTGRQEWGIVRDPDGHILGIHSLAPGRPIKRTEWPPQWAHFEEQESYAGWVFGVTAPARVPGREPGR
ncbi:MAG TPA: type II secretion system protein [Ramlibacter sp.]|jgi:type II secretory pathway pseudopilin PulG